MRDDADDVMCHGALVAASTSLNPGSATPPILGDLPPRSSPSADGLGTRSGASLIGGELARDVGTLVTALPPATWTYAGGRGAVGCIGVIPNAARTE